MLKQICCGSRILNLIFYLCKMAKRLMDVAKAERLQVNEVISL